MTTAKERMIKAEKMYEMVVSDNEKIKEIIEFLNEMPERMNSLSDYYFNQWMKDIQELENTDFHNGVMNEDSIYEEISKQYEMMKKIILIGAQYINQDFN